MNLTKINKSNFKKNLPKFVWKGDNIDYTNKVWLAGGVVRDCLIGIEYSDVDVFGTDIESLNGWFKLNEIEDEIFFKEGFVRTFEKDDDKIQLIYKFYKNIEECLDSFDFTICQFAYDGNEIICNSEGIVHLYEKKLVVHKLNENFVLDSMRRMQKYIKKGYTICNGGLFSFVETIRATEQEKIQNQIDFYPDGSRKIRRFD